MAVVVDRIIHDHFGYSPLEDTPESCTYISEQRLQELVDLRKRQRRNVSLVGKKRDQETAYFYINAWMFGEETLRLQRENGEDPALGVLFRDSDGTRSSLRGLWEAKRESMLGGFTRSGLGERGVPMIPKPKSEAWLLCAARPLPYTNCGPLEDRSGNDVSPNSLKEELLDLLGGDATAADQVGWLTDTGFDHVAVAAQMGSFHSFKGSLLAALAAVAA